MDLLADDFALSPPALALLAAYDAAVKEAETRAAASRGEDAARPADEAAAGEGPRLHEGEEDAEEDAAPAAKPAVPRLAPETVAADGGAGGDESGAADDREAADLHGLLLAAGALDVDLSDVSAGVRYRVTRSGRGLLAKAA